MCFVVFLPEKTGTFSANFNIYFMLKMLEMAFPGFKFQKFSGGGCPRTPLQGVASGHACVAMLRSVYNARSAPDLHPHFTFSKIPFGVTGIVIRLTTTWPSFISQPKSVTGGGDIIQEVFVSWIEQKGIDRVLFLSFEKC